ncbi:hypothetical protein [Candidatus Nitrosotenuis uzonensis]|uniref:Uncharacterized protein n=1 Tax=Candidatus Nitrosotenuis uzonensis TaxID=1407055 RepID=A0A812F2P1_9ARCH|nr:hypothetical protein [Candidatus Nitrosotenuis uzonensis]CAE6497133.1 conserved membrane hypothetical protein [Candidatus Nitrosotenuis uzonensis]
MQTVFDTLFEKKYLIASLVTCTALVLLSNYLGVESAIIIGNLLYIPTSGALLILAILILVRFGTSGYHGVAWFAFTCYSISWFVAEMLWIVQELYLNIDPFPSAADIFYIIGYPFLLMFFVAYLQPVKVNITKKMFATSTVFAVGILVLGLYLTLRHGTTDDLFMMVIATAYPAFDSMIIIPALLGVGLFFKGKVNLMWTLICFGAICVFIADTAFLLGQNDDTYYTGNPLEIPFYWNYILLSFGVYSHLGLFRKESSSR